MSECEALRRQCLAHEGNLIGIGIGMLSGVAGALVLVWSFFSMMGGRSAEDILLNRFPIFGIGLLLVIGGSYTRKLHAVGRLLLCIAFVFVAMGTYFTIVGAVFPILFTIVLWQKDSKVVFSDYYRNVVILETPFLKPKRGNVIYGCVFALGVLLVLIVSMFYFLASR